MTVATSIALAAMLSVGAQARQTSLATNSPTPLSTRVVAYDIDAHVDVTKKTVDATETLTYKNLTGQPLATFPFHLYLNAFQPDSTFTSETHAGGGIRADESGNTYADRNKGSITIAHLEADGYGDLTPLLHFTAPDDHNANDRTVAELALARALAPGESITFHLKFHDQFPESVARNGYKRDFLMGGQWFPKLGVFWHGGWNCHQYHATTEFFSDFGVYNVRLTLPTRYTVGASGVPTGVQLNNDGTRTETFYGEDIHDFAWAASPNFTVTTGTYLSSMGPVQVRVLALAAHPKAGHRYLDILLASLREFDQRYGPYPYKILTLIDPEPGSETGGMEYPTLVTGETAWLDPSYVTEVTAEHEFGHQYWYGMVATNEFEEAWLDEGINSYTESIVNDAILGPHTSFLGRRWINYSDLDEQYSFYQSAPGYDPVTRPAWQFRNASSYGAITYGKSSLLLHTLAGLIGEDVMAEAMRTYFMRFRFTHPTTEDFLRTIEEVAIQHGRTTGALSVAQTAGPNPATLLTQPLLPGTTVINSGLRPFLNQAVYGTAMLDYGIDDVVSEPQPWWLPSRDGKHLHDTVTVRRVGDFVLPVTLEVRFADGTRRRETWDGQDRWHSFMFPESTAVVSAEIDPDHLIPLDNNRFNNSWTLAANPVPARKVTTIWASSLQLTSQVIGWLI